jgi:hypothetical protein
VNQFFRVAYARRRDFLVRYQVGFPPDFVACGESDMKTSTVVILASLLTSLLICGCQDDRHASFTGPNLHRVSFLTEAMEPVPESQEKKEPRIWLDQDAAEFASEILSSENNPLDEVYVLKWSGYPNCKVERKLDLLDKERLTPAPFDFKTIGEIFKLEQDPSLDEFAGWMVITRQRVGKGKEPEGSGSLHEIRVRYRIKTSKKSKIDGKPVHSSVSSGEMIRVLKIDPPANPKVATSDEDKLASQLLNAPTFHSSVGNGSLTLSASPSQEQASDPKPWLSFKITPVDRPN